MVLSEMVTAEENEARCPVANVTLAALPMRALALQFQTVPHQALQRLKAGG